MMPSMRPEQLWRKALYQEGVWHYSGGCGLGPLTPWLSSRQSFTPPPTPSPCLPISFPFSLLSLFGPSPSHSWLSHRCLSALEGLKMDSSDEQRGVDIIRRAMRTPAATIAKNAGVDPSIVVEKILAATNPNEGYDALHDTYVDMIQEGGL